MHIFRILNSKLETGTKYTVAPEKNNSVTQLTTPAMSRLPTELIDIFVDYFSEDRESLRTCSLVCKTWMRSARRHLFANLSLDRYRVELFLNSALPVIPFVRHLTVHGERIHFHRMVDIWAFAKIWNNTLPQFVNFERINSLSLSYLPWSAISVTSRSTFISNVCRSTTVRRLELQGLPTTRSNFTQIIHAFPFLTALVIHLTDSDWRYLDLPAPTLHFPSDLRSLDMYIVDHSGMLDWLLSPAEVPNIRTVHFRWRGSFGLDSTKPGSQTISNFFRALGPSLQTVNLSFTDCNITSESLRSLDWNRNTHLCSIGFEIGNHFHDCTVFVTQMLSQVDSVVIERITFTLLSLYAIGGVLIAGPLVWSEIEAELAKPRFSRLKRVDVAFLWVEEPYMLLLASIYLPRCHERGILHISEGPLAF